MLFWILFLLNICFASESYDYVVIGAGPAGLSSAIELSEAGVERVLVIENRLPTDWGEFNGRENVQILENGDSTKNAWGTRNRNVAIDGRALGRLKQLGVNIPYFPIDGVHFKDGSRRGFVNFSSVPGQFLQSFINRDFAAAASISNIERGLLDAAVARKGIDVIFGANTEVKEGSVVITNDGQQREIEYRNLVVASGAHSKFLESLGFSWRRLENTRTETWHVGSFKKNSAGEWRPGYHFVTGSSMSRLGFQIAIDAGEKFATVYVNGESNLEAREALLKAQKTFGLSGTLESFESFESAPKELRVFESAQGLRVIPVGDALFSHDPALGGGISSAIRGSQALGSSLRNGEFDSQIFRRLLGKIRKEWLGQSQRSTLGRKLLKRTSTALSLLGLFVPNQSSRNDKVEFLQKETDFPMQKQQQKVFAPKCSQIF